MSKRYAELEEAETLLPGSVTITLVIGAALVGLYLLFPHDFYKTHFNLHEVASETSLQYLKALSRQDRGNLFLKTKLIHQQIEMGKLDLAQRRLREFIVAYSSPEAQEEAAWLQYIIDRERFFQLTSKSAGYVRKKNALKASITQLMQYSDNDQAEYILLARDAEAINSLTLANAVLVRLFKQIIAPSLEAYQMAAKLALSEGYYKKSSDLYLHAMNVAKEDEAKRDCFYHAIRALEFSGDSHLAFATARKYFLQVPKNQDLYIYI